MAKISPPIWELPDEYHCTTMDLRNANGGGSGPVEVDRLCDSYADDRRSPHLEDVAAETPARDRCGASDAERFSARSAEPILSKQHEELGASAVRKEGRCYGGDVLCFPQENLPREYDFVFSVTRDFVRRCTTPVLFTADDTGPHPYTVAEETAMLAPNAQMTFLNWKEAKDRVSLAVLHLRAFLKANRPT